MTKKALLAGDVHSPGTTSLHKAAHAMGVTRMGRSDFGFARLGCTSQSEWWCTRNVLSCPMDQRVLVCNPIILNYWQR